MPDKDKSNDSEQRQGETRCGFVTLLGAPNAGKSTLLNQMVGAKVSIVTPKVQTTRFKVLGIVLHGAAQIVFVDTPGIFAARKRLERAMVAAAWSGAGDADAVAVLIDASRGFTDDTRNIIEGLKKANRPAVLVVNKIDLVHREILLPLVEELVSTFEFERVFMVSALTGNGVRDLVAHFAEKVPAGPWLFDEDQISDMPARTLASEITREKLFMTLRQELPYALAVETDKWEERKDGSAAIYQTIYVERDNQKAIILGHGGRCIKSVGAAARKELEELLERRLHLFLFVKVRENWTNDPDRYRDVGLDFNS